MQEGLHGCLQLVPEFWVWIKEFFVGYNYQWIKRLVRIFRVENIELHYLLKYCSKFYRLSIFLVVRVSTGRYRVLGNAFVL